jgi:molecular chaperone Hsp33
MNKAHDTLHHFLFEHTPIRGNIAKLDSTFLEALEHQTLPPLIKQTLGELMTASALLISTLKMEGAMILQLQSKGLLKLLVVECNSDLEIRATAKWDGDIQKQTLAELIGDGQFVITLDPKVGEAYQGIVPIEGNSIASMLENYMLRSQQIDTSIWLSCDAHHAAGLLLQKLPNEHEQDVDAWNRVNHLAGTVTGQELQTLPAETLLQRLFHEEDVRLFAPRTIKAFCSCSREGVANMLKLLGKAEAASIIEEQGSIQIHCDFCNQHYVFDEAETEQLFGDETASDSPLN